MVELEVKPAFIGQAPAALTHCLSRPRGGNLRDLPYNFLLEAPVGFDDGWALAPERPGHGLRLSEPARAQYAQPEDQDVSGMTPPPGLNR